jgi:hypothetical protein
MNSKSKSIKILSLSCLAFLLLANQQCELPQEQRPLKKNIQVVGMHVSSFLDQTGFNFSEVANSQLSGVLFDDHYFFERTLYPQINTMNHLLDSNTRTIAKLNLGDQSQIQIKKWFPLIKTTAIDLSPESSCLITKPQHYLYGKMNTLEASGGGQVQFGFNLSGVQLPVNAKIKIDRMTMDMGMTAFDPWTQQAMGSVNSFASKTDYKVGFGLDLGIIHIGPEFYKVTGLAELTLKTLRNALKSLASKLNSIQRQEWQSRILLHDSEYVVILGGAELGLHRGDILKVENEIHHWIGTPCGESSVLAGSVSATTEPLYIQIEDAGNLMSKAKILNASSEFPQINVGALVRPYKLLTENEIQSEK